ncbi:MAG: hypothetical protein IAE77_19725 [Prosthecobacter sp.]|jgi:hypothetical protein|uniref:hypothetical protein n=1 Tax=Prosthecobacter sp. TaxID=1965333 RepID=UPI0019F6775D|nr:hypothetical protein [Prosthecobacter sp.]MBE2285700.1 hypothetical protein [Prosthecobacter sp.]
MSRSNVLLACVFSFLASANAQDGTAVELKLYWQPGQIYTQESDTDTTNFLTALGKTTDQKLRLHQTTRIAVQQSAPGQTEAKVTIEHLLGEMHYEGQSHLFDSNNPEASHPLLRQSFGNSAGKSFTLVYDEKGNFIDAKDTGSMVTGGVEPDLSSIATARQLATLYRRSLEMGLPKIPVHPGDKWISDEVIPFAQAGTVQVKLNAKFDGVVDREGHQQAQIAFEGTMKSMRDKDSTGRELRTERPVTFGDDSKVNGHVFFDLDRRTISLAVFSATIQLKVEGKPMPVRQQVTTKLVSIKPAVPVN